MLQKTDEEFLSFLDGVLSCRKCELSLNRTQVVPYRGDPRTDLMIVAEAPGFEEDKRGMAMVGRAGQYFVDLMTKNGFPPYKLFITNCILCRPPENADPSKKHLEQCVSWLNQFIEMIEPKVIIAVGRFAGKQLISEVFQADATITKIEGKMYRSMNYGCNVIPVRHPSAILRQPTLKPRYEELIAEVCLKVKDILV